jgi:hypothetical protein
MAVIHRLRQRKRDTGATPDEGRLFDAELGRDLIGSGKADAANVACEAIGIFRDQPNGIGTISLVDAHCARRADPVAVQKQHDLADHLLFGPAGDNALGTLWADPADLAQPAGLLGNDLEHRLAERAYKLLGIDGANAANHARAQILLDPLDRGRCRRFQERCPELDAMGTVVDPAPARLDKLTGRDHCCMTDHGDWIALPARLDPQYAETVLRIVKGDAIDEPG